MANPFDDPAHEVLSKADIPTEDKEKIWDAFFAANSVSALARSLSDLGVEPELGRQLCIAKAESLPKPTDVERVHDIMKTMAGMDKTVLEASERHPNVLRILTSAKA